MKNNLKTEIWIKNHLSKPTERTKVNSMSISSVKFIRQYKNKL